MIYFIADTNIYKGDISFINGDDITILPVKKGILSFISFIGENEVIGFDIETNGLDAYLNKVVLWGFGNQTTQYIFHSSVNLIEVFKLLLTKTLLGHNIKFDIKFVKVVFDILITKVYDTMIAEQRLYQKSDMSMTLAALSGRYLNEPMFKEVREEFIGCNVNTFQLYNRHIRYAANDIRKLHPIKEKQTVTINRYGMNFLLYDIEFPLISIIAKAELTGFKLDEVKWRELYEKNIKRRFELECLLDEEVRKLRNTKPKNIRLRLTGGKYDQPRILDTTNVFNYDDDTTNVIGLFGELMSVKTLTGKKKKIVRSPNNTNYSSPDQKIEIFAKLEEPLLTEFDSIAIPQLNKRDRKVGFQTNSDAFEAYLKMKPDCNTKQLIEYLIEYGSISNMIKNFGLKFLNKVNPITGKIHTIYRQATADTSRFQSGGGDKEPDKPNFQNIPAITAYRNCFVTKGTCSTTDFSGAELMIMVSLSQDQTLKKLAEGDMHSHMNQAIWRNIYKYRYNQLAKMIASSTMRSNAELDKKLEELAHLANTFEVSKTVNKAFRNKNLTFGSIYGMYAAKAGKTMNVSKEEGQIAINTIKSIIPKIFQVVEAASKFVEKNGYIIICNRTKSRAWFPNNIKALKGELNRDENFKILQKELSEARNIKIQGTQADFVKEATVVLQKYIDHYHLPVTILHWIHDEIVDDHAKYLDGISDEWKRWIKKYPQGLSIIHKGVKKSGLCWNEVKELIMTTVADRYLDNVEMKVESSILPYWTK